MKLILRGHHLLCLKGFQEYGYDENFTKNMTQINDLRKLEDTTVSLVNCPDDLCRQCPNLKNGLCKNETHIKTMDNNVLKKFDDNKVYNAVDLFKEVDEIFNDEESVENICFNCIWHDKCLFYQKLD